MSTANPSDDPRANPPPWGQPPEPYPHPAMPPPSGYPVYPGQPYPPPPSYGTDPTAPYGRDPATGEPLSDKTAIAGGLLQIFFGMFGVGRFYIHSNPIAIVQLCLTMGSLVFGILTFGITFLLLPFIGLWAFVDGILIITGSVKDGDGRKLR